MPMFDKVKDKGSPTPTGGPDVVVGLRYWHRGSNARRPTTIADVPRIGGGWHDLTVTADESRSRAHRFIGRGAWVITE
jgi:hypothetical protein